jgi:glycosyltransferase involved in cell wall biosynthesis
MSLSVIMPTIGRGSLDRAVKSVVPQLLDGDELVVIGDGPRPNARAVVENRPRVRYDETPLTLCWGHAQRNHGMKIALGTHLAWLDDDDIWLPGARREIQKATVAHPNTPIFFRMQHRNSVIWRSKEVLVGNVSTQIFVFPNLSDKLPEWGRHPETKDGGGGDFLFAAETVRRYGGNQIFLEPLIAKLFDHGKGRC